MTTKVLVIGGTGTAGAPVVRRLLQEGAYVAVLSRRPEAAASLPDAAAVIVGDVEDEAALDSAMAGCTGVHLSIDGGQDPDLERRAAGLVSRAAARHGVSRITLLSGATVSEGTASYAGTAAKLAAERAVRGSGIPSTVLRASFLMESLPRYVRGSRASVLGRQPTAWHWLAADDLGAIVARAHLGAGADGTFVVKGPEPLTLEQALRIYCAAARPEAKIGTLPFWMASLLARMPGADELSRALPFARYTAGVGEVDDVPPTDARLGTPSTTLAEWSARAARRP